MERFADVVLRNPSLALVLVEQPDFWARLSPSELAAVGRARRCPPAFVAWVHHQSGLQPWRMPPFFENPHLLPALRRESFFLQRHVQRGPTWWAQRRALLAGFLSADELSLLERGGVDATEATPRHDPTLTEDELGRLGALGFVGQMLALGHPRCPGDLLAEVATGGDLKASAGALRHPRLPADVRARELARALSASPQDRYEAAGVLYNPALTEPEFDLAAADARLHSIVVRNPGLPRAWMARFLDHPALLDALAANPSLPADLQLALADAPEPCVRWALARRRHLAPEVMLRLAADASPEARMLLGRRDDLTAEARALLDSP
jgi:hypothetical protein